MKKRKINLIVTVLFIFFIFFISYLCRRNRENDIENHSKFTIGQIIKFSTTLKSGDYWDYQFEYNGKIYKNSKPTHVDYNVKIGDYFLVNFSSKDPEHSKILYEYKLNDDKIKYIHSVWDTIPKSIFHGELINNYYKSKKCCFIISKRKLVIFNLPKTKTAYWQL